MSDMRRPLTAIKRIVSVQFVVDLKAGQRTAVIDLEFDAGAAQRAQRAAIDVPRNHPRIDAEGSIHQTIISILLQLMARPTHRPTR